MPTYVDPTILYLTQVLAQVRDGTVRIPRFQRPFIWTQDKQLELLRSIREGIPIGALMVWRTTDAPVEYYRKLDRFPLAVRDEARPQQYLLDGLQRVTTLYGALMPTPYQDTGTSSNKSAYFSFADDDFVFADADQDVFHLMPLSVLTDTHALLRYQRALSDTGHAEWLSTSDAIASAFREYKIPIIPINTDDIASATKTFQRVNTQSARMSDLHMVHALTWKTDFDLQDKLAELKDEVLGPLRWNDVDDDVVIKVCKGLCGLNLYKTDPKKLSSALQKTPELLDRAVESIAWAASLFKSEVGIHRPELVPYSFQTVFVALERQAIERLAGSSLYLLKNWFWFTTYAEAFSGMSDDKVRRALEDFTKTLKVGRPIWSNPKKSYARPSPREIFNPVAVRSKATLLCLARRLTECKVANGFALLGHFGRDAVHPLRIGGLVDASRNSVGNRILVAPTEIGEFREREANGLLSAAEVEGHFLLDSKQGFFSELVNVPETRTQEIWRYETKFAERTAGVFAEALEASL